MFKVLKRGWEGFKRGVERGKALVLTTLSAGSALVLAPSAEAAVPVGVETVFTTAATDFATVVGYGWTLFLGVIGSMILFKLVKKVFFRAT